MNARRQFDPLESAAWLLLCLFVFSIPWEKSVWVPGIGTISRFLGMVALAAGLLAAIRRKWTRAPNLAFVLAGAFVAWSCATYFWSLAPEATAARGWTFVQLLAMVWLVWDQARVEERPPQLMQAYVAGAVLASLATLARYVQNLQTYYRRYAAPGFDPNDLALTVALSIPMAFYLASRSRGIWPWMYRAAVLPAIAAILLAASRTALIGAFLAFCFVIFTWRQSDRPQRVAGVLLLGVLLLGTFRLAPSASRERLATLPNELTQGTLHNRTRIWKAGLKTLKQYPLAGAGAAAYPEAVRPALGRPAIEGHEYVAHNTFLSVLVETGMIGLALYGAMLATLAVFVWMMPFIERVLWAVMLAVWATGVSTLTWEHRKPSWLIFALIMTQWATAFRQDCKRA
ncbi:MAG TPA: O-antigen ligase family protein [Bryobacteraceae bacterium]|nr:O-antigen ligase family protein [Bryobacteraceae bacterium]HOQ46947.1 O-antigen ligase family protein [Bryobacteraceae bacterium]HPU73126.1 O-antigen ligase family protein [Bryobacteraceae bacterium]